MPRHHIFLSYSRQDSDFVFNLHDQLGQEGLSVWIDREGIQPGTPSWRKTIQDAIDQATCLLVVLSPDAKESHWVGEELNYAQAQGKRIFYVLARGDERTAVPFGHSAAQWIDMRAQQSFAARFKQLADAVFDFLQIDSDTFKKERLRIEEERRRKEHEERERRAREEAQRLAAENAARTAPLHPQYVTPPPYASSSQNDPVVYGTPDPAFNQSALPSSLQGVPGRLYQQPARAVEVAGLMQRLVAIMIDGVVLLIVLGLFSTMVDEYTLGTVTLFVGLGYDWCFWTWFNGQTPGKMMMGIRIVAMSGEPMGGRRAGMRMLGMYLNALVMGLGYLLVFMNQDRRTLHDYVAGTRVVKT